MTNPDSIRTESPLGDEVLETAYNSVVAELEALSPEELYPINMDVMTCVNTAAGVLPEVKALRAQIVQELPKFNIERLDKLHRYAMAAAYAHTMHLIATGPHDELQPVLEESLKLRELLLNDVTALATRGLVSGEVLKNLKGAVGYKNVQLDLQMLVSVLKANWPTVQGKCATSVEELARGERLVTWLIEVVGLREQGPAEKAKSADMRLRAFTLFTRSYDEVRRAVGYLRWKEGDVDNIIPSFWAGRPTGRSANGKKASDGTKPQEELAPKASETPAAAPTVPTVPAPVAAPSVGNSTLRQGGPYAG